MRKQEFLDALKNMLTDLPQDEVAERLNFYSEMIDDRIEEGVPEEEAVAACGTVEAVAAQIKADSPFFKTVVSKLKNKKKMSSTEIVLLVVGAPLWFSLAVALFAIVLSLYVSLWAVLIALWATGAALIGGAIGGIAAAAFAALQGFLPAAQVLICFSLISAGLTIFFFFGCKWATKGLLFLTRSIARLVKKRFAKKEG